jgi:SnoaL-like protein
LQPAQSGLEEERVNAEHHRQARRDDEECVVATIRRYFFGLDAKDGALIESCFSGQATTTYNAGGPAEFSVQGRHAIAARVLSFANHFVSSVHALGNARCVLNGDRAECSSFVTAHILTGDTITVRGLRYDDALIRAGESWLIDARVHAALWQYEVPAARTRIPR